LWAFVCEWKVGVFIGESVLLILAVVFVCDQRECVSIDMFTVLQLIVDFDFWWTSFV